MKNLLETWAASNARFESLLAKRFAQHGEPQQKLFQAMNYSLLAGGKRLRPFLVYQFCAACGGRPEYADPAAIAVELIHTYSLIHDDLPAMDNDDYRRGRLTNHKVFGEAMAILAGDGLLTDAFSVLTSSGLPAERIASCVGILSENAGPWGMVGGQVLDILSEERELTEQEVLDVQTRKTGALIRAACEMGVVCGGGNREQRSAARRYAEGVGLAFQIRDDVLDVIGDAETLGKAVGVDANKNTFVRLYGLDNCEKRIESETERARSALSAFDDPAQLKEIAVYLSKRDH